MSKDTEMLSADEVAVASKEERREKKKEKKEKKEKKRSRTESNAEVAQADATEDEAETPAKKRKREILPEELEIDISLPEPASKKAARKAKKAKLNPTPAADVDGPEAVAKIDGAAREDKDTAAQRSAYGVWIGNLPWSATRETLRKFLTDNTEIASEQITRVHMPPPTKPTPANWTTKPTNKGFAYVDFSTELAMYSAIALTETKMDGRALLIKNAKSFDGRPDKPKTEETQDTRGGKGAKQAIPRTSAFSWATFPSMLQRKTLRHTMPHVERSITFIWQHLKIQASARDMLGLLSATWKLQRQRSKASYSKIHLRSRAKRTGMRAVTKRTPINP
jgi:hypothetical protein